MMSPAIAIPDSAALAASVEKALVGGDLAKLTTEERLSYYKAVCESVGLNPLTRPFEYITLNGKLQLYARKDCTDQLRNVHGVSITIPSRESTDGCYVVTARATLPSGRTDESIGAVQIEGLKGDAKANAIMKTETKAKRRVTLSICGLGLLDETELETIPAKAMAPTTIEVERTTEDIPIVPGKPKKEEKQTGIILPDESLLITSAEAGILHRKFRQALRPEIQKDAEKFLHDWLGVQMHLDANGNPSALAIKKENFVTVGKAAVAYAKEL
jgi:hypothetical protein